MYGLSYHQHSQKWELSSDFSADYGQIRLAFIKNKFLMRYDLVQSKFCNVHVSAGPVIALLARERGAIPNYMFNVSGDKILNPYYVNQVDAGGAYKTLQPEFEFICGFEYKPLHAVAPFVCIQACAGLLDIEKKDTYYYNPYGGLGNNAFDFSGTSNRGPTRNYSMSITVGVRCKLKD